MPTVPISNWIESIPASIDGFCATISNLSTSWRSTRKTKGLKRNLAAMLVHFLHARRTDLISSRSRRTKNFSHSSVGKSNGFSSFSVFDGASSEELVFDAVSDVQLYCLLKEICTRILTIQNYLLHAIFIILVLLLHSVDRDEYAVALRSPEILVGGGGWSLWKRKRKAGIRRLHISYASVAVKGGRCTNSSIEFSCQCET